MSPQNGGIAGQYYKRRLTDDEMQALAKSRPEVGRVARRFHYLVAQSKEPNSVKLEKGGIECFAKVEISLEERRLFCLVEGSAEDEEYLRAYGRYRFAEGDMIVKALCERAQRDEAPPPASAPPCPPGRE